MNRNQLNSGKSAKSTSLNSQNLLTRPAFFKNKSRDSTKPTLLSNFLLTQQTFLKRAHHPQNQNTGTYSVSWQSRTLTP